MAQESWKREQEETACQTPEGPVLCVNNCGFFGASTTMGMCSKCYRDWVLKQAKTSPGKVEKGTSFSLAATGLATVGAELQKAGTGLAAVGIELQKAQPEDDSIMTDTAVPVPAASLAEETVAKAPQGGKQLANRCFTCKKKVGLTGFKCRCDRMFCSSHRHSDQHCCPYDYKAAGRDAIAKANPVVKAEKIDKI